MGCTIIGCGKALPALEVGNDELKALVDTSDEWVVSRTGISTRHIAVTETAQELAESAARQALGWTEGGWNSNRIDPQSIDLVIYATISPDALVPAAAAVLRHKLGLNQAVAFDLNAACTGFVYGLTVAEGMMAASSATTPGAAARNPLRRALVVGTERLSRLTDWEERSTCVLFGDGAGAAVIEWDESKPGILGSYLKNDDDATHALSCPMHFGAPVPFDEQGVAQGAHAEASSNIDPQVLTMDGPAVYKFATEAMTHAITTVLERTNTRIEDVACIVPHQANERIIKYAARKMKLPMELFQLSIDHTGNTSAASVPMALTDAYLAGRIHSGDKVLLVAFGGGFTSGAILYEA